MRVATHYKNKTTMPQDFLDFRKEIEEKRTKITKEVCNLLRGHEEINCRKWLVGITNGEGDVVLSSIYHTAIDDSVQVKSCYGTVTDFSELSTDDMVALYEFIYERINSEK